LLLSVDVFAELPSSSFVDGPVSFHAAEVAETLVELRGFRGQVLEATGAEREFGREQELLFMASFWDFNPKGFEFEGFGSMIDGLGCSFVEVD
jgi:hypothetical protein